MNGGRLQPHAENQKRADSRLKKEEEDMMAMMQQVGQTIQEAAQAAMVEDIGTFTCTAYAYTGSPCANGDMPTTGHTIACNSLPFGTKLKIEGLDGIYEVEDRGASWHSDRWLDIYMGDVEACMNWGKQDREVYIIHEKGEE